MEQGRGYCLQGAVKDTGRGGQQWCGAAMMFQWLRVMAWNNISQRSGLERIKHFEVVSSACNYERETIGFAAVADGQMKQTAMDGKERHFQELAGT